MARPAPDSPYDVTVHTYLTPALADQLDQAAGQEMISRSAYLRRALVAALRGTVGAR